MKNSILILLLFVSINAYSQVHKNLSYKQLKATEKAIFNKFGKYPTMFAEFLPQSERKVRLERVACSEGRVNLYLNEALLQIAIREDICKRWEDSVRVTLGQKYNNAKVGLFVKNIPVERYIPNLYRRNIERDDNRSLKHIVYPQLVKPLDEVTFGKGLSFRTLAMWPSHGAYYDNIDTVWKFQRPALFGTIEDIHTYFWLDKYVIPMLENSGATIITNRERDVNVNEIILDNDSDEVKLSGEWTKVEGGFKKNDVITNENPFQLGSALISRGVAMATYKTTLNENGQYAVYVSYKRNDKNSNKALYSVKHKHGVSKFEVNQTIGGGWVYLGKFDFEGTVEVVLSGNGQLSTDAVKIGGGMGNVLRGGKLSGAPRWAEAARYFMQYSGVTDNIYFQEHEDGKESDYKDDYKARGDWVNYLIEEQKIPVDLSFALHTNAGITDTIFGSLTINYTENGRGNYSNGKSKFAGRDFADILLSEVTQSIRKLHDTTWVRKSLYDRSYAEVSRPDVPAVILELLSHQNINDMKWGRDSMFRFNASRAIYKGMLKFIADRYGYKYQVQPLPVVDIKGKIVDDKLKITWNPQIDPLEESAKPLYYKIFTCVDGVWNKGAKIESNLVEIDIPSKNNIFKIVAYNEGGKSFDLETFQFDESVDNLLKITRIPLLDYSVVGVQTDFDTNSQFIDNDNPGHGATDKSLLFKGVVTNY